MLVFEHVFKQKVADDFRFYWFLGFGLVSLPIFIVASWLRANPATYEATITKERFVVLYPDSEQWSFNVKITDIKRFENRNTLSPGGKGIGQSGILMNDGTFHEISMNYQNNINKMHKAIQSVCPEVEYPKQINTQVTGFLNRRYQD